MAKQKCAQSPFLVHVTMYYVCSSNNHHWKKTLILCVDQILVDFYQFCWIFFFLQNTNVSVDSFLGSQWIWMIKSPLPQETVKRKELLSAAERFSCSHSYSTFTITPRLTRNCQLLEFEYATSRQFMLLSFHTATIDEKKDDGQLCTDFDPCAERMRKGVSERWRMQPGAEEQIVCACSVTGCDAMGHANLRPICPWHWSFSWWKGQRLSWTFLRITLTLKFCHMDATSLILMSWKICTFMLSNPSCASKGRIILISMELEYIKFLQLKDYQIVNTNMKVLLGRWLERCMTERIMSKS